MVTVFAERPSSVLQRDTYVVDVESAAAFRGEGFVPLHSSRIAPSLGNPVNRYSFNATAISAMAPRLAMKPAMVPAIEYAMGPTSARSAFISWRC